MIRRRMLLMMQNIMEMLIAVDEAKHNGNDGDDSDKRKKKKHRKRSGDGGEDEQSIIGALVFDTDDDGQANPNVNNAVGGAGNAAPAINPIVAPNPMSNPDELSCLICLGEFVGELVPLECHETHCLCTSCYTDAKDKNNGEVPCFSFINYRYNSHHVTSEHNFGYQKRFVVCGSQSDLRL
eukprot:251835_1